MFVRRHGSRGFWIVRFGRRHDSAALEDELQSQGVLFEVKHSQRRRDGIQLPGNGSHHLPKEIIQFRDRGERIQTSPECFVRFRQLGHSLLGKDLPLACHGRSHFLRPFALSNIDNAPNVLEFSKGVSLALTHTRQELDRSIRDNDSILKFKIALGLHRPVEELFERRPILRMNSLHNSE